EIGISQGSILSPLLSNLYLHELDLYMDELGIKYQGTVTSTNRKRNPIAHKLLRQGRKAEYNRLKISSRVHNDPNYRNCKYIRYADDFVVGILGPRSMAIEIKTKIQEFLSEKLQIELNGEKSNVTHISKGIKFLGYKFGRRFLFTRSKRGNKLIKRKMTIPTLDVNMEKLISRLKDSQFCDGSGNPEPAFRFLRHSQADINKRVNSILTGLSNWWSIAGNRRAAIARTAYIIRYSIAKVYAAKFKLGTVAKVFKKGGNNLSKNLANKANLTQKPIPGILFDRYWYIPKPRKNKLDPNWKPEYIKIMELGKTPETLLEVITKTGHPPFNNPLSVMGWRLAKAETAQGIPCKICGTYEGVQMHHRNPLRNIPKTVSKIQKHKMAMERKQIPLCHTHHLEFHKGNWRT
ncbi:MAG: group II intron reverse transcriptase/maturase, partial [Bacteroidota bacterium]